MRRLRLIWLMVIALMVVAIGSCGEKTKAEKIVKDFMKTNMEDADLSLVQYSRLDSTFHIDTKAVNELRTRANDIEGFRKNISYTQEPTPKLLRIRVTYKKGKDKALHAQTFYLDEHAQGVVAFKNN